MSENLYEAYALRYASIETNKAGKYHDFAVFGEPDEAIPMDFYFWLLRSPQRVVLVDCGYDDVRTPQRGFVQTHRPVDLLARFDVQPEDVEHVIVSHMHFDHIGNVDLFPNAQFSIARAEMDFWTGPYANRIHLGRHAETAEIQMLVEYARHGRVHLVDGPQEVLPGIRVTPIRGHTAGSMITAVDTASGVVVLASDAIHLYEEMELDRPYWVFTDLEGMYRGYAHLTELAQRPDVSIVAGHDRAVMHRFAAVDADCVDLTAPVEHHPEPTPGREPHEPKPGQSRA